MRLSRASASDAFLDKDVKAVAILGRDIQELDANSLARIDVLHDHRGVDECGPERETQTKNGPLCKAALPGFDERASNTDGAETLGCPSEQSVLTEPDFTIEIDAWMCPPFFHVRSALKGVCDARHE